MHLVKCDDLAAGPGPSERVVEIPTSDGREEVVLHSSTLDSQGRIEVGVLGYLEDRALIELPREFTAGRWRIWVPASTLITNT